MIKARKWVAVDFGGPEVLRNVEVDVPDPGRGQVTIDIRACGMNPADANHIRARARTGILKLAQDGDLVVPMAETFEFDDAPAAFAALTGPHPPGKLALVTLGLDQEGSLPGG